MNEDNNNGQTTLAVDPLSGLHFRLVGIAQGLVQEMVNDGSTAEQWADVRDQLASMLTCIDMHRELKTLLKMPTTVAVDIGSVMRAGIAHANGVPGQGIWLGDRSPDQPFMPPLSPGDPGFSPVTPEDQDFVREMVREARAPQEGRADGQPDLRGGWPSEQAGSEQGIYDSDVEPPEGRVVSHKIVNGRTVVVDEDVAARYAGRGVPSEGRTDPVRVSRPASHPVDHHVERVARLDPSMCGDCGVVEVSANGEQCKSCVERDIHASRVGEHLLAGLKAAEAAQAAREPEPKRQVVVADSDVSPALLDDLREQLDRLRAAAPAPPVAQSLQEAIDNMVAVGVIAKAMKCSDSRVYQLAKDDKIPSVSFGRGVMFDLDEVLALLDANGELLPSSNWTTPHRWVQGATQDESGHFIVTRETQLAIMVEERWPTGGTVNPRWVPKSVIGFQSEVKVDGDQGALVVTEWWAKETSLPYRHLAKSEGGAQ